MKFKIVIPCVLFTTIAAIAQQSEGFMESFDGKAEATLPKDMGWLPYENCPDAAALVSDSAGFTNRGLRFGETGQYQIPLSENQILVANDPPGEFRVKLRMMDIMDSDAVLSIILAQNNGVNGMGVLFVGGSQDGMEDNTIQVSMGGAGWGEYTTQEVEGVHWEKEKWYEVIISDIKLSAVGNGATATASLTVIELGDQRQTLVTKFPFSGFGQTGGPFSKIDVLNIGEIGAPRQFDIDDLVFGIPPNK